MQQTSDIRIESSEPLIAPHTLSRQLAAGPEHIRTVIEGRKSIENIIRGRDSRMLIVVGPCSIHDAEAGLDYARKLSRLAEEVREQIYIVMRVYFEKPRTALGWRGLILDPHMNGSYDIHSGLHAARKLLLDIAALGLPAGSEILDPVIPQYIDDLLSWGAIGARTAESQVHREIASGLSMPIGFKNGTDGLIDSAVNAMTSSRHRHSFIGIDSAGKTSVMRTHGNAMVHLILRGGKSGPNYSREQVEDAGRKLRERGLWDRILIDCSHANSGKDHERQHRVFEDVIAQHLGDADVDAVEEIMGCMLESNHFPGRQDIPEDIGRLRYGVSITDACIGWDETERIIRNCCERRARRRAS